MSEFKTPTTKKYKSRMQDNPELRTPIKIPASPFLTQIGYGCGVNVFTLERSPKVGFSRSPWAIKKRNRKIEDNKYNERIRFEADVLRKLNHENIVGFRAFAEISNGEPCLLMEKLDSSLGDKIEQRLESGDDQFPANNILKITYEIVKGLEYLHHTAHILHGDIKSYNVLVSTDYKIVKLCDFGVSLPLTDSLEIDTSKGNFVYVGTECWSAPEIIFEDGPTTNKADIWACGLVVWEMIALSPPHVDSSEMDESCLDDSVVEIPVRNNTSMNEHDISMSSPHVDSSEMDESCLDDSVVEIPVRNNTSMNEHDSMDDSIGFLNEMVNNKCGTRPPLPAINLGKEYEKVLEIFFACTSINYKLRPSAKGLANYFRNYVYKTNK